MDNIFKVLKCVAMIRLALRCIPRNIEGGTFGYFYAHKNNRAVQFFKLVCEQNDVASLYWTLRGKSFVEHCTRESAKSNGKFTNLKMSVLLHYSKV